MRPIHAVAAAVVFVVMAQALFAALGLAPSRFGPDMMLAGPDAYMRLLRVEHLWQTGAWYDTLSPLTNAPYGESLHWTRPLDLLLMAGAWPLSKVFGIRDALFLWGSALSPLLQGALVVVLWWGTRRFLTIGGFLLLVVFMVLQPNLYNAFMAARPDHQSLLIFLFALAFVMVLRVLSETAPRKTAFGAGAVTGLALWVSVEAMMPTLAALIAMGGLWVWRGGNHMRTIDLYLRGVIVVVTLALVIERPPGDWLSPEYDRLSVVHWALFAALAAVWAGMAAWPGWRDKGRAWRLAGAAAGSAVPALIMVAVYPSFFDGPFARIDPMIVPVMLDHIREYQPLMPVDLYSTGQVVFLLGPVIPGLAFAVYLILHGDNAAQARGLYFLVGLALFTPLALLQVRWGPYVAILMLLPWVELANRAWRWQDSPRMIGAAVSLRVPATFLVIMGPVIVGGSLMAMAGEPPKGAENKPCRWQAMVDPLRRRAAEMDKPPTIMGLIHDGPEILYRTGLPVVSTPYHRNWPGIYDTYRVLTSDDDGHARAILSRRGVDYIAFCRGSMGTSRFLDMPGETLFKRLYAHRPPSWLVEERLESPAAENFQLFRVAIYEVHDLVPIN